MYTIDGPLTLGYDVVDLFTNPAENDFGGIYFSLKIEPIEDVAASAADASLIKSYTDSLTGDMLILPGPQSMGMYTAKLRAVDVAGNYATVRQWLFRVSRTTAFTIENDAVFDEDFETTFASAFSKPIEPPNGLSVGRLSNMMNRVVSIGVVHTIASPVCGTIKCKQSLFGNPSGSDFEEIKYRLNVQNTSYVNFNTGAMNTVWVDSNTGAMMLVMKVAGEYVANLTAADADGEPVVVKEWKFTVEEDKQFATTGDWQTDGQLKFVERCTYTNITTTEIYSCAGPAEPTRWGPKDIFRSPAAGNFNITYRLEYNMSATETPCLIDTTTGEFSCLSGWRTEGAQNLTLFGIDGNGQTAVVGNWVVEATNPDTLTPAYGPGGTGCNPVGTDHVHDETKLDGRFTCVCNDGWALPNCNYEESLKTKSTSSLVAAASSSSSILVLVMLILAAVVYRKHVKAMAPHDFRAEIAGLDTLQRLDPGLSATLPNGSSNRPSNFGVPREVPRRLVQLGDIMGEGNFGTVHEAVFTDDSQSQEIQRKYGVAVKSVKSGLSDADKAAQESELLSEAAVMAQISRHDNVCALVGVITRGLPIQILVELCSKGSLLSVLTKQKTKRGEEFTLERRLLWASQVAAGMAHLSEKHRVVHRDLAARNVLVDALVDAKIADFGPCFRFFVDILAFCGFVCFQFPDDSTRAAAKYAYTIVRIYQH
jgi:hypothetical protein